MIDSVNGYNACLPRKCSNAPASIDSPLPPNEAKRTEKDLTMWPLEWCSSLEFYIPLGGRFVGLKSALPIRQIFSKLDQTSGGCLIRTLFTVLYTYIFAIWTHLGGYRQGLTPIGEFMKFIIFFLYKCTTKVPHKRHPSGNEKEECNCKPIETSGDHSTSCPSYMRSPSPDGQPGKRTWSAPTTNDDESSIPGICRDGDTRSRSSSSGLFIGKAKPRSESPSNSVLAVPKRTAITSGANSHATHRNISTGEQLAEAATINFLLQDEGYAAYSEDRARSRGQGLPVWPKNHIIEQLWNYLLSEEDPRMEEIEKEDIVQKKLKKMVILLIDDHIYDVTRYAFQGLHPGGMKILKQHSILRSLEQSTKKSNEIPQSFGKPVVLSESHRSPGVGHKGVGYTWFSGFAIEWIDSSSAFHFDLNQHSWMAKHKLRQFRIARLVS